MLNVGDFLRDLLFLEQGQLRWQPQRTAAVKLARFYVSRNFPHFKETNLCLSPLVIGFCWQRPIDGWNRVDSRYRRNVYPSWCKTVYNCSNGGVVNMFVDIWANTRTNSFSTKRSAAPHMSTFAFRSQRPPWEFSISVNNVNILCKCWTINYAPSRHNANIFPRKTAISRFRTTNFIRNIFSAALSSAAHAALMPVVVADTDLVSASDNPLSVTG